MMWCRRFVPAGWQQNPEKARLSDPKSKSLSVSFTVVTCKWHHKTFGPPCYIDPNPTEVVLNCNGKWKKLSRVQWKKGICVSQSRVLYQNPVSLRVLWSILALLYRDLWYGWSLLEPSSSFGAEQSGWLIWVPEIPKRWQEGRQV